MTTSRRTNIDQIYRREGNGDKGVFGGYLYFQLSVSITLSRTTMTAWQQLNKFSGKTRSTPWISSQEMKLQDLYTLRYLVQKTVTLNHIYNTICKKSYLKKGNDNALHIINISSFCKKKIAGLGAVYGEDIGLFITQVPKVLY